MSLTDTVFYTSKLELLPGDRLAASGVFRVGAGFQGGVQFIDVTDPANPVLLGSVLNKYNTGYYGITEHKGFLLVAGGGQILPDGTFGPKQYNIHVIDIDQMREVGIYDIPDHDWCWDVDSDDNYVYAAQNKSTKVIKDIPLVSPQVVGGQVVGSYASPAQRAREIVVKNDLGFISDQHSLVIVDLSNSLNIQQKSAWRDNTVHNFACMGCTVTDSGKAYFAASPQGMYILDVGDSTNPRKLGQMKVRDANDVPIGLNPTTQRVAVDEASGKAAMANAQGGYMIVDIANPGNPTLVKHTPTAGTYDVVIHKGFVIAAETGPTIRTEPLV